MSVAADGSCLTDRIIVGCRSGCKTIRALQQNRGSRGVPVLVTRLVASESSEVKVLNMAKKVTSLKVKVLGFIFTSLLSESK